MSAVTRPTFKLKVLTPRMDTKLDQSEKDSLSEQTPLVGKVLFQGTSGISTHAPTSTGARASSTGPETLVSQCDELRTDKVTEEKYRMLGISVEDSVDEVGESECPKFIFSVDESKRKSWLERWRNRSKTLLRVSSIDDCLGALDGARVVGRMDDLIDASATKSETGCTYLNRAAAVKLNISGGCSGIWDIDFDRLVLAVTVDAPKDDTCAFPLKLNDGLHICALIRMMFSQWTDIRQTADLTRQEIADTDEAFEVLHSNFPAMIRNLAKFEPPNSLKELARADAFDVIKKMESMASNIRETNVLPKTPACVLFGFMTIYNKLPEERRTPDGLLDTFTALVGNRGIENSNVRTLKYLLDPTKSYVDLDVLNDIANFEASMRKFEPNSNRIATPFSWEVLGALFRHNWNGALHGSYGGSTLTTKEKNMVLFSNSFFVPGNTEGMMLHNMLGEQSFLRDFGGDGLPFGPEKLRHHLLATVTSAIARFGAARVSQKSQNIHKFEVLQMKLASVVWCIFKAHGAFHLSLTDLKAEDRDGVYRKYFDPYYAVQIVLAWYSLIFDEARACQACNDSKFVGFSPAETISPCKDAMHFVQVLKDEESRATQKMRLQEEAVRQRENLSLVAALEKKQQEAEEELRELKLKQMKETESQLQVILDQAIASATRALADSRASCASYREQIEKDLAQAAYRVIEERISLVDYSRTALDNRGLSNSGSWIPVLVSLLRVLLQGRAPSIIYIDGVDDDYGNAADFTSCSIPTKGRDQADQVELLVKELVEQCPIGGPEQTTVILRYPTGESGFCSAVQLKGSFGLRTIKECDLPRLSDKELGLSEPEYAESCGPSPSTPPPAQRGISNCIGLNPETLSNSGGSATRGSRRPKSYWCLGQPLELHLQKQYEAEFNKRVKKYKMKRSPTGPGKKGSVLVPTRQVAPPFAQEYVYAIQRNAKHPTSGRACSNYANGTDLRRTLKQKYFQKDHMRLMMLSAKKDSPLSQKSSDLSLETLKELFESVGLREGGKILILSCGENNCNSVLAAAGAIGASVILPMRLSKLEDYPKLYDRIVKELKEGIQNKIFKPCGPLPLRRVNEPVSFVLGAVRQVVQLVENRAMTREEEADFEAQKLDIKKAIIPFHCTVQVKFSKWSMNPLDMVNARLKSLVADDSLFDETIRNFEKNISCYTRGGDPWLHTKRAFEKGDELFRLDGTIAHCCSRGSSVAALVAARCGSSGEAAPEILTRHLRRCWQILLIKFFMPFKSHEHPAEPGTPHSSSECASDTGFHILKDLDEYNVMEDTLSGAKDFHACPVRIDVDCRRTNVFRVVANRKLLKDDPIWVCRENATPYYDCPKSSPPKKPPSSGRKRSRKSRKLSSADSVKAGVKGVESSDLAEARDRENLKKLPTSKASTCLKANTSFARRKSVSSASILSPGSAIDVTTMEPVTDVIVSSKKPRKESGLSGRPISKDKVIDRVSAKSSLPSGAPVATKDRERRSSVEEPRALKRPRISQTIERKRGAPVEAQTDSDEENVSDKSKGSEASYKSDNSEYTEESEPSDMSDQSESSSSASESSSSA